MQQIKINGLRFEYDRDRDLFNALLKINGVTKKKFCEKFDLSYSYVNAWGSTTKEKDIKFPSWVLIYLKDVMYFKIEAIKIKMSLNRLYDELESGRSLTTIFKELNKTTNDSDETIDMLIPDDIREKENSRVIQISK
ncbi:MAG: hypothetical protein DRG78_22065 [Epsilonproteobacteria bacterium]|nr:MAG: hypothetical protein DRG78_22065 [Campylobacterota bacterium]